MKTVLKVGASLIVAMAMGASANAQYRKNKNGNGLGGYTYNRTGRETNYILGNFGRNMSEQSISKDRSVSIEQSRKIMDRFLLEAKEVKSGYAEKIRFDASSSAFPVELLGSNSVIAGIENAAAGVRRFTPSKKGFLFVPVHGLLNNVIFEVNKRVLVNGNKMEKDTLTAANIETSDIAYSILSMMEKVAASGVVVADKTEQSRLLNFGVGQLTKALSMRRSDGSVPAGEIRAFIKHFPDLVANATQELSPGSKNVRRLLAEGGATTPTNNPLIAIVAGINRMVGSYRQAGH